MTSGGDAWVGLLPLGLLLLYLLPALLCLRQVLRNDQPRIWLLVFFCMPLFGPLLYLMWPRGGLSRPRHGRLRP
jgi:hypothetical protein